jgi:hypothetical protein
MRAVPKQLGHATASITLDTYGPAVPDAVRSQRGPGTAPDRSRVLGNTGRRQVDGR